MANNYSIPALEKYEWYEENVVMEYPTLDTKATIFNLWFECIFTSDDD